MIEVEMTSLEIAEITGKEHRNVLRDIRNKVLPEISLLKNEQSIFEVKTNTYKNSRGKEYDMFILNKFSVNALMANYSVKHAVDLVLRINDLEQELIQKEEELAVMKNIVWKVINNKSYLGREYALKSAGIKHPRLFMKYLRNNKSFYESTYERDFLKNQYVSPNTQVEMFTQNGFQWLLNSVDKINDWVETQKKLPA